MKLRTIIFSAYQALLQNLRRSLLTMLGIVIGIASVITILSLGRGFQAYTIKNLTQSSDKNVRIEISFMPNDLSTNQSVKAFNELDLHLVEGVSGVSSATFKRPEETSTMKEFQFQKGKYSKLINFKNESKVELLYGRNFSQNDNNGKKKVAIISKKTAGEISADTKSVLGYGLNIDGQLYTVVGISKMEDNQSLFSATSDIEIPKATYDFYHNQEKAVSSISVLIESGYKPSNVGNEVVKKLTEMGTMSSQGTYSIMDMSSIMDSISQTLSALTFFISGIAGISLFIAGVGVMNMMYTSVSERTQEIGVRRAMGAKRSDIRNQFLAEGLLLTISAGIIGYIIGFLVALIISQFLPFKVSPDLFTIVVALGTTTIIGLVFSIMPASSAARKDLVEILR